VAFTPPSSVAPASVVVDGSVSVSNFPADQLVHFTTPVAVTGPLTDAQLRAAAVSVSGPLTDAQLRAAAVVVDGSAVVQPVSGPLTDAQLRAAAVPVGVDELPLPDGAATDETLVRAADSLDDVALTAILQRDKIPAE